MSKPEKLVTPGERNKICKLRKAIYGLKQAPKAYLMKIGESLSKPDFVQSTSSLCLFT